MPTFEPLDSYIEYPPPEMVSRSQQYYEEMRRRRTVRDFAQRPVEREIIENCLRAAGTAVSGANMQPWQFVVVENAEIKSQIRLAAEDEERAFYSERAPQEWLDALAPLGACVFRPIVNTQSGSS